MQLRIYTRLLTEGRYLPSDKGTCEGGRDWTRYQPNTRSHEIT
jgi:hypothetical protein